MKSKTHLILLTSILSIIAIWMMVYKIEVLDMPVFPDQTSTVWSVEAKISFTANNPPIKVNFSIPPQQKKLVRLGENFVSRNYGSTISSKGANREATLTIRRAQDTQTLYYQAQFYYDPDYPAPNIPGNITIPRTVYEGAKKAAAETLVANVRESSADSFTFATEILKALSDTENGNAITLLDNNFSSENIARTAVAILYGPSSEKGPNIKSRLIYGFALTEEAKTKSNVPMDVYLSVWDSTSKQWNYANPVSGEPYLPDDFLIWQYGDAPLLDVEGGNNPNISFSFTQKIQNTLEVSEDAARARKSLLVDFSLFSLPIKTQEVYQVLLMIPLGAMVILILRSFVGLQTFGTFMPVLIALAFRETHLLSGIILFTVITLLGLVIRFYLERLKLLLIPRLSAVLSTVVILMVILSIFSYKLGLQHGLSIALFPMVILTMTIERMSIVWEERGAADALKQAAGSLIAASLAYLVMINDFFEHIVFVFPESLLLIMSIMLWMGQYHGYRLSELKRFQDMLKHD